MHSRDHISERCTGCALQAQGGKHLQLLPFSKQPAAGEKGTIHCAGEIVQLVKIKTRPLIVTTMYRFNFLCWTCRLANKYPNLGEHDVFFFWMTRGRILRLGRTLIVRKLAFRAVSYENRLYLLKLSGKNSNIYGRVPVHPLGKHRWILSDNQHKEIAKTSGTNE